MTYHYSPHTGELIATDNPADWMASTDSPPPAFDAQTAGCFWRDGVWVVVQALPSGPTIQDQLAQLDAANTLTQRNLRETVMLMAEAFKTVTNGAVDLSTIPGVAKVYAVEAEAAALRSQL